MLTSSATSRPAGPPALLDQGALERLRELDPGGKAGLVARVLTTYTLSLEKLLDQLARARTTADASGLRHVAHTLKSSSASVGALELSHHCAEIEARLRDGVPDDAALDAMAREGSRVLAALRASLAPQSAAR